MPFDAVPWFVGGGAQHSPEVARVLAYAGTSGAEGVVAPGGLKVQPLNVPGGSVRVAPGACLILNKAAGGSLQTYVGRHSTESTVAVTATGSGSGRSDLVVARVEDPFMAGEPWSTPVNPAVGPYVFIRVISNVPAGTTTVPAGNGSAVALARLDIPANTGTIQSSHIVDLRQLAQPRSSDYLYSAQPPVEVLTSTTFVRWPRYNPTVRIPEWATFASLKVDISGAGAQGNVDGVMRARIGDITGGEYIIDVDATSNRESFTITASGNISASDRGRVVELVNEARLYPSSPAQIGTNIGTHIAYDVRFYERTV